MKTAESFVPVSLSRERGSARMAALGLVWLAALTAGTGWMNWYTRLPGRDDGAPLRWPREAAIAPDPVRPTLLLFLHPQCACSRATLAELERFAARAGGRCAIRVLFLQPIGAPEGWEQGALWDQARAISGAAAVADRDGAEAARFHAATSGWTLLYSPDGRLLFQGGITPSRGHEGDSAGRDALDSLVGAAPSSASPFAPSSTPIRTPVFGCALAGPKGTR